MKEGYKVTYDREERNLREPEKSARGSADLSYSIFRWLIFNLHCHSYIPTEGNGDRF